MASKFNFKTDLDLTISGFQKEARAPLNERARNSIIATERTYGDLFDYAISDDGKTFLSKRGIYVSPFPNKAHPHPICKMIENHILYKVVPGLLSGFNSVCAVSVRPSKVAILESLHSRNQPKSKKGTTQPSHLSTDQTPEITEHPLVFSESTEGNADIKFRKIINRCIQVKDSYRYSAKRESSSYKNLSEKNCSFDDIVKECGKNSDYFFHDEVHHWSRSDFFEFLNVAEPESMLFTVVYPVEILKGIFHSCNPGIYEFYIKGDKLIWAPDGVYEEAYIQPADLSWLFGASSFVTANHSYSLSLIDSIGAHHVFALVKGNKISEPFRIFSSFSALDLGPFEGLGLHFVPEGIRFEVFMKVIYYIEAIRKVDEKNAVAKLRQLDTSNFNVHELVFVKTFAEELVLYGFAKAGDMTFWGKIWRGFFKRMPVLFQRMLGGYQSEELLQMLLQSCGETRRRLFPYFGQ